MKFGQAFTGSPAEGGKGSKPCAVHIRARPAPLAK